MPGLTPLTLGSNIDNPDIIPIFFDVITSDNDKIIFLVLAAVLFFTKTIQQKCKKKYFFFLFD